ncbi:MAG: hypothetical protein A2W52_02840 [Candidatus Taylorbacteria bacterium RIFCSPHIGHO2_02_49_25]|uniref:Probable peptidoglycan glycosyltransferase FtsW n=1 Tax=Candidatus Taylorbacteria bacterium RIFCSPHIGHO2_02_49_25 TaxID=1802305 RepID=A0A1G2MIW5_9BACT|nr:MAG: Stage V sporulation protein E [Parcubacteria group bacterium GW2011_GWF2_50_9]OHA21067.1 MAG: hypothetical protein A2759_00065 [Candidatus Taylorbacteria bacterium RIFCSPHIGHO2_01_FULL_49_60]OHA23674.1 MAG: hypothetical protein A2W52_02840 [Candidatus Taylorbacteria bacterium RIFCSPHIGHO2_02_49_25]OHA35759.1 MAG: hypothetical protein A3B27_02320 [Candidatus Taylorbacteria bacterium RIFCSPLOWO2_01_FULL_50_130]OHA37153.1 MAG: hypothetical protein A2W65_02395 [Candidatus Taylorbacteria bac
MLLRTYLKTSDPVDRWLLWILIGLIAAGFFIFLSASIGLHAREGASFKSIIISRLLATTIGICAAYMASLFHYKKLRRLTLPFLLFSTALSILVFIPGVGVEHGGARRWISIFGLSFQPAELLKLAFVIYAAAILSAMKEKSRIFSRGPLLLLLLSSVAGALLLLQPDTDTFIVLFAALLSMFIAWGGRWRHVCAVLLIGLIGLAALVYWRPYLKERVTTFLEPATDVQGAGWQVNQSLIAIGSGGFSGRGFGQSVQKFSYLPEPIGDSIFAVAAEEFGFLGSVALIGIFLAFFLRGLRIASRAPDLFSGLLSIGIVILIGASAFMNMGSMLAIIPLSGLPLAFISHGGTALVITLFETGILLNISRYQKSAA